nr:hypothetical protein [Tanacetum cinerariifolium]
MILESVEHDLLIWPTVEENGVTRTKKYAELSATEKIQADCDMKATNIILQGLPADIYKLVNHHRVAKDLWEKVQLPMQVQSSYPYHAQMNHQTSYVLQIAYQLPQVSTQPMTKSPLVDSGLAVLVFSLGDDPIACLNKAMAFLIAVASSRGNKVKVILVLGTRVMLLVLRETIQVDMQGLLNVTTVKTEDLDTYNFDCDDISNAKGVLMANISNYGSDVISKEKANKEQNNESVTIELERYKERVKTFEQRLNIDLSSREKMIDSQMDDMIKEKIALKEKVALFLKTVAFCLKPVAFYLKTRCVLSQDSYARSRPNGKMIVDSIKNGPYVRRMIATPGEPDLPILVPDLFHEQMDEELTENDIKRMDADDQAIQTILLVLPEDVYAVDSCETAKEIWERVRQVMKGFDIEEQEKKAKLFNEWEKFTSTNGESIESYYHHFMQLMNDLKRNKHFLENIAANLKFLNNLQPEWKRHVIIVRQTKNHHETDFTQIYDFLKMNQDENVRGNGGNQFGQYARQVAQNQQGYNAWQNGGIQVAQNVVQNAGVQSSGNQNGLVVVPGIANQNGTGNVVATRPVGTGIGNQARCYNFRGLGH